MIGGYSEGLLKGKVALVTGGARGQGRSHAVGLAAAGAQVAVCDLLDDVATIDYPLARQADLEETVEAVESVGGSCLAMRADVRDMASVREFAAATVERFGRLDIVVANAGVYSFAPNSWSLSEEQFDVMVDVNLTGVWRTCAATIPHLIESGGGGSLVLISSINGLRGVPGVAHYNAAKHALVGITRTFALELARHEIRVNTLHPTAVYSPMTQNEVMPLALGAVEEAGIDLSHLLEVEMLEPEDVTAALLWLVSPLARRVTGISLPVDAGLMTK